MKHSKYISKKGWLKLFLLVAIIAAACAFDYNHQENQAENKSATNSNQSSPSAIYFCTPSPAVSFKAPVHKSTLKKQLFENAGKLALQLHNARTHYLLKAESVLQNNTDLMLRKLLFFRYYHQSSPDDKVPLS